MKLEAEIQIKKGLIKPKNNGQRHKNNVIFVSAKHKYIISACNLLYQRVVSRLKEVYRDVSVNNACICVAIYHKENGEQKPLMLLAVKNECDTRFYFERTSMMNIAIENPRGYEFIQSNFRVKYEKVCVSMPHHESDLSQNLMYAFSFSDREADKVKEFEEIQESMMLILNAVVPNSTQYLSYFEQEIQRQNSQFNKQDVKRKAMLAFLRDTCRKNQLI